MSTTLTREEPTVSASPATNLRVYSTLSRQKEAFTPVTPGKVGIYLCGPTVYDKAHIGHMVGPVIFDCIKRYLQYCGYKTTFVVNITDVDDKLINKSRERGISMEKLAEENIADYLENLAALAVDSIDHMPKATETMTEIVGFIEQLVEKDFAYEVEGDVFFDVMKDTEYGKLTNRSVDQLQGEGGGAAAKKRSAADFALWKAAKPGEPSWDSPWGKGRPGWHIECSAMSKALLGESFDIHGGGLDLIFPHHENEIAQSECCHGKPMARYWMHNGLLRRETAGKIGGRAERQQADSDQPLSLEEIQRQTNEKVARSRGAGGLADQIAQFGGETLRFFLLRTHYRSTIVYGDESLGEARTSLDAFYRFFKRYERITGESYYRLDAPSSRGEGDFDPGDDATLQHVAALRTKFVTAMDDDFNTGAAVGELFELVRTLNKLCDDAKLEDEAKRDAKQLAALTQGVRTLKELTNTLGLFRTEPHDASSGDSEVLGKLMELVIDIRASARKNKDFATADKIRDGLKEIGITLEDRPGGTDWTLE